MPSSSRSCYFDKCCFCVDLKTGCFILAYLNLIGVLITTILVGVGLGAVREAMKSDPELQKSAGLIIGITSVLLVFLLLALIFSIVLLVGLHQNKPGHVKCYLIYNAIFLGIYAAILIINAITGNTTASIIVTKIVQILISVYFLLVIRSYYIEMKGNSRNPKV